MVPTLEQVVSTLGESPIFRFSDWPNLALPHSAIGLYSVWRGTDFIYIGTGGRVPPDRLEAAHSGGKVCGLKDRLDSHASGQRSGDRFCIYVADRLVLPTLSSEQLVAIGTGRLRFDALIRAFIREHLAYRVFVFPDRSPEAQREARRVERTIQRGETALGRPLLNPQRVRNAAGRHEPEITL